MYSNPRPGGGLVISLSAQTQNRMESVSEVSQARQAWRSAKPL